MHGTTNGWSTDLLAAVTNLRRPKVRVASDVVAQVRRDGWAMLPFRMDDADVEALRSVMQTRPGVPKGERGNLPPQTVDLDDPVAPAYPTPSPHGAGVIGPYGAR